MIQEVVGRVREGKITRRNLEGQRRSAFKGRRDWIDSAAAQCREIGQAGIVDTEGELDRQEEASRGD